ncbi:MAG: hypothetical protein KGL39_52275 [Patescibacteria group bacterium]|nr:hypothetical protein [Patescibacteria group bacterium]
MKKIDDAKLARLRELHAEGRADKYIAIELGISGQTAAVWRRSLGLPRNLAWAPPRWAKFVEMWEGGFSRKEIGEFFRMTPGHVGTVAWQRGLPPRPWVGRKQIGPIPMRRTGADAV